MLLPANADENLASDLTGFAREDVAGGEEAPVGRRLRSGLQHLRQGQFQHSEQAGPRHPLHQRLSQRGQMSHCDRGQQEGPAAPADGAEWGGLAARPADGLPLLRGVGGRELPQRAHGVPRAGGQDEGRQAGHEEAHGSEGHREEHVCGVRQETDGLPVASPARKKGKPSLVTFDWVVSTVWPLSPRSSRVTEANEGREEEAMGNLPHLRLPVKVLGRSLPCFRMMDRPQQERLNSRNEYVCFAREFLCCSTC